MYAAWLLAAGADLNDAPAELLIEAIAIDVQRCCERILHLLAITSDAQAIATARTHLAHGAGDRRAYAIEIIDVLLPPDLKPAVLPLFDDIPIAQRIRRLHTIFPQPTLVPAEHLSQLITDTRIPVGAWTRSCALHSAAASNIALTLDPDQLAATLIRVDRVVALRNVQLFAATPSEILASIAERLDTLRLVERTNILNAGAHVPGQHTNEAPPDFWTMLKQIKEQIRVEP